MNVAISLLNGLKNSVSLETVVEMKFKLKQCFLKLESIMQPSNPMLIFCYQKVSSSNFYEKTDSQCSATHKMLMRTRVVILRVGLYCEPAAGTSGFTHSDSW